MPAPCCCTAIYWRLWEEEDQHVWPDLGARGRREEEGKPKAKTVLRSLSEYIVVITVIWCDQHVLRHYSGFETQLDILA